MYEVQESCELYESWHELSVSSVGGVASDATDIPKACKTSDVYDVAQSSLMWSVYPSHVVNVSKSCDQCIQVMWSMYPSHVMYPSHEAYEVVLTRPSSGAPVCLGAPSWDSPPRPSVQYSTTFNSDLHWPEMSHIHTQLSVPLTFIQS